MEMHSIYHIIIRSVMINERAGATTITVPLPVLICMAGQLRRDIAIHDLYNVSGSYRKWQV